MAGLGLQKFWSCDYDWLPALFRVILGSLSTKIIFSWLRTTVLKTQVFCRFESILQF